MPAFKTPQREPAMSQLNVLDGADPAALSAEPYAHLVRNPALPEPAYARLAAEFPDQATILGLRAPDDIGNAAARLPAFKVADNPAISPLWRDFFAFHSSGAFWQEIVRVFGSALREAFPAIEAQAGKPLADWQAGPRGIGEGGDIRLDCQFVINTPARRTSSVKTQHVDKRTTILSMLLYLRDPEDDAAGGDLEIYAWKREPRFLPFQRMILPGDLELRRTVKYAPNTLAAFVNSEWAPHGVSPRGPAQRPRRYINFIAETPFKAFRTPEIGLAGRLLHWPQMRRLGLRSVGNDRY
jgi:hypothetical protein